MSLYQSQREAFASELYDQMENDNRIWLVTGDLGFGILDAIRDDFPSRFTNVGASEQAMLGIAVGLALKGKIVFCYTITSFFLRAAETIGLYLHNEGVPVKLVGSGRDNDYKDDGISHDATLTQKVFKILRIESYYPQKAVEVQFMVKEMIKNNRASFISLQR